MKVVELELLNESGLHARPASRFVPCCQKFKSKITIEKDGTEANGKSILSLMTLGASFGDSIKITADGDDESEALGKLEKLVLDFN